MISAVTGLPELMIDKQNDVHIDIESNEGRLGITSNKNSNNQKSIEENQQQTKEKKFNQESIDELNKELGNFLRGNKLNAEFMFEKDANQLVMKLIDSSTKEVVRQVPPEFMLKIAKMISSQIDGGALADAKV